MEWNWLTIAVAGVFLLGFLIGIYRGAIRIAVSLATTILTIVIVVAASPYVSSAIEKHTPIDDMIKSQVTNTMAKAAASSWPEAVMTVVQREFQQKVYEKH